MLMLPRLGLVVLAAIACVGCGGGGGGAGGDGPRVQDSAQSIAFDLMPLVQAGEATFVQARASSGLAVSYSSLTPAVCTVDTADGSLLSLAAGDCAILANQGGNDRFAPAAAATLTFSIAARVQAIDFDRPPALTVDGTASVRASASSGLPVRYSSLTPALCTIDPDSGATRGHASGHCVVAADQPGDPRWAAAPRATQSLTIPPLAQNLDFADLPALRVGATTLARASASSGLPASFTGLTPTVCSIDAGSKVVSAIGAGTCTIAADQVGDTRWAPAAQVQRSIVVSRAQQAIRFGAAPTTLAVAAKATVRASADSGLAVAYASLSPGTCSVDAGSGVVIGLAIGPCTISASQAGDAAWAPAPTASHTFAVAGLVQAISFAAAPPSLTAGTTTTLRASASSGLAVTFSSLTAGTCSVDAGGVVSGLSAGTCTIAGQQAGDSRWAAAPQATLALITTGASQTISFSSTPSVTVGGSASVRASTSSGLAVSYTSLTPLTCSVHAASGTVTGLAIGPCTIAADQTGNGVWAPAPQATQTTPVAGRAQTITFGSAPALSAGSSATVRATASSGLSVSYSSLSPAACTVNAASGLVTSLVAGACTIAASQAGNSSWAPAPQAVQTLAAAAAAQSLAFGAAPATLTVGGTVAVRAVATSGLAVNYSSLSPAVCSVNGASGLVAGIGSASCTIAAHQPGNATWAAAAQVTQTFDVVGMTQMITFGSAPSSLTAGATATVHASASSGLAVSYSSLTPGVCSVNAAGVVSGLAAGGCTIAANQAGDTRWAAAAQATLALNTASAGQTISFGSAPSLTVGAAASVRATASSALAVSYASLTPLTCSVHAASGVVSALAIGPCTIAANQAGNSVWAPAPQATQTTPVAGKAQTITFAGAPLLSAGSSATVRASASSGLAVSYTSLSPAVCTVHPTSGLVTSLVAGACTIAASQAGNSSWAPAPQAVQSLGVSVAAQSVIFGAAPGSLTVGSTVAVRAVATSGLPVHYSSLSPTVCGVHGTSGLVAGIGSGSCAVAADQAGNATWAAAAQATQTFAVVGKTQTIGFAAAPSSLTAGTAATVRASASSALAVTFTTLTPAVCSVVAASGVVTALTAGSCSIAADQSGNGSWAAAAQAVQTFAVSAASQAIGFAAAPSLRVGGSATVRASASSALAVSYTSLTPQACSVHAASGAVTGLAIGPCTIAANQTGNSVWAPASQATQTIPVAGLVQTISFANAPSLAAGGTASVRASADSGLAVSYSSLSPGVCTVNAASGLVTGLVAGTCTIAASQAGNSSWAPAPQAVQTLAVSAATQSLAFGAAPASLTVGSTVAVRAVATSGLAVNYSSLSPAVCSVNAASGLVVGVGSGNCTIAANQPGDATWAAAAQATQSFAVVGMAQTIAFGAAPSLAYGATANVRATASSGLAVTYRTLTPAACAVDAASGVVTALAAGSCSIAADQSGNGSWAAAAQVIQTFSVNAASQVISFGTAPSLTVGSSATVRATASSGLAVSFSTLTSATCTVVASSGVVTGVAIGTCTIAASQTGNANWAAAAATSQTLTVAGFPQSISFGAAPALAVGGTATVRAVATSGLAVGYTSLTPALCTVNAGSGVVFGVAPGTCRIAADQPGNSIWSAAAPVTQTLTVAPNPNQTISFAAAPTLSLGGTASVRATASSGLAVTYSSLSASVCSVHASSGLVTSVALGDCVIAADQAGNSSYNAAPQARQTLPVQPPAGVTVPGVPQGVSARLGSRLSSVVVAVGSVDSGGSPISGYTVVSRPAGITVSSSTAPVSVTCPTSCAGYAFAIQAINVIGPGSASAMVDVITTFDVVTTFYEPDTQPRDSIFTGSFVLNSTTGAITGLAGWLTESMTGNAVGSAPYYDMTQVPLVYPLQTWRDATLGGTFVASFAKNTTRTFTTLAGGDGWSPQAGVSNGGVYAGFPAKYAGTIQNSSILVFVPDDPFAPLGASQIAKLAYADCAPGGMMGAVCMTGTSIAGYGAVGTMSGYPVSQRIVRR